MGIYVTIYKVVVKLYFFLKKKKQNVFSLI